VRQSIDVTLLIVPRHFFAERAAQTPERAPSNWLRIPSGFEIGPQSCATKNCFAVTRPLV
jgi:hypothetical protein